MSIDQFRSIVKFELSTNVGLGAAYGTAKSGTGIAAMSVMRPDLVMKSVIPVIMAGIIAIYGLVVSVVIGNGCESSTIQFNATHSRVVLLLENQLK